MAEQSEQPPWQPADTTFTFHHDAPARIPRGWERAPKSPYGGRHGGRKVWKRYEVVGKDHDERYGEGEGKTVLGDATNTSRSVKRMRVKGGGEAVLGKENREVGVGYLATARDKVQGTPRRKQAPRKSLKSDHARPLVEDAKEVAAELETSEETVQKGLHEEVSEEARGNMLDEVQDVMLSTPQTSMLQMEGTEYVNTSEPAAPKEAAQEEEQGLAHNNAHDIRQDEVVEDTLCPSSSPALDDVRELPSPASNEATAADKEASQVDEDEIGLVVGEVLPEAESRRLLDPSTQYDSVPLLEPYEELHSPGKVPDREGVGECSPDSLSPLGSEHSPPTTPLVTPGSQILEAQALVRDNCSLSPSDLEAGTILQGHVIAYVTASSPCKRKTGIAQGLENVDAESISRPPNTLTPTSASAAKLGQPKQMLEVFSPGESPQIGTSLLRRESLRKKETPSKGRELRKSRSPKKETLSRRDTLQEREILQRVIAETNQVPSAETADPAIVEAPILSSDDLVAKKKRIGPVKQFNNSETSADEEQPTQCAINGAESSIPPSDDAQVEKDLYRAKEAIEVFQHPAESDTMDISIANSAAEAEEIKALDRANEVIAKAELEEASQTVEAVEQKEQLSRRTRSGARFSDDTSMLRDFLNRAQASKAAKIPILSPPDAPQAQTSPRRSPRKALGPRKKNTSTPKKSEGIANRPGTPPGVSKADVVDSDDAEETSTTPPSYRRSTRARLPVPSKAPPGAPSFIPVRRADGTDPVVLQKSQAQELAMVTRANTRRNKGQSKPPLLVLKDFTVDTTESAGGKQHAEDGKSVGWAATLASYQEPKEAADEVEESRPKVRRLRGLGAGNGTPGPKKSKSVVGSSNGTPARRGKVR